MNAELESIDAVGAVLSWRDSEYYPERLAQFDDAPAGITARGNLHLLTQPMIAIVGARNASINAQRHAHNIASELGKHGYIIVSGMARGIDAAAHRGALDTGTIGDIAGGIDIVYLPENADLFEEVATRCSNVMAVPRSPLDPRSDGSKRLIRDGTTLVQNVAGVIECVARQPAVRISPKQFE